MLLCRNAHVAPCDLDVVPLEPYQQGLTRLAAVFAQANLPWVTVTLESLDGAIVYASETFEEIQDDWHKHVAVLEAQGTNHGARLAVRGEGGPFLLDVVSLFPGENGREGRTSPFRNDLLSLLKGLRPRCSNPFQI
jgi:hypothetical protein